MYVAANRWTMIYFILLLSIVLSVFLNEKTVFAHAFLKSSIPASESTSDRSPTELRLEFTEGVRAEFCTIKVTDSEGNVYDEQVQQISDYSLEMTLPPLENGVYSVYWQVLSVDGHVTDDRFRFSIGTELPTNTPSESVNTGVLDKPNAVEIPTSKPVLNPNPVQESKTVPNPKIQSKQDAKTAKEPIVGVNESPKIDQQPTNHIKDTIHVSPTPAKNKTDTQTQSDTSKSLHQHTVKNIQQHEHIEHSHSPFWKTFTRIVDGLIILILLGGVFFRVLTGDSTLLSNSIYIWSFVFTLLSGFFQLWMTASQISMNNQKETFDLFLSLSTTTNLGWAVIVKIFLFGLLFLLSLFPLLPQKWMTGLQFFFLFQILFTFPITGHAIAATSFQWIQLSIHLLHMITVICWIGGLYGIMQLTYKKPRSIETFHFMQNVIVRFSMFAFPLLSIAVITGIGLTINKFNYWNQIWTEPYGQILITKVGLTMVIFIIGALHKFYIIPKMERLLSIQENVNIHKTMHVFVLTVRIEIFLAISAFCLAGVLAVTAY
jgi:methionine-rich copper-binding protein CopC/putative copper export protein